MSNKKIRIGLIGAGNICQNAHIPAYLKQEDVELVAVCDLNEARATEVATKYNIRHVAKSIEDLVALDDVDAVSICTWNNAHARAALAAVKAGKHVLCEKPMATTVAEAQAMYDASKNSGKVFMLGFVNRFRSDSLLIKEMADAGKFGDIYFARAGWLRRRGTPLGWFTDVSKSGGGPVIDIGVHVIDLTWHFMGKPEPVSVSATTHYPLGDYKTKGVGRWLAFDTDNLVFNTEDSAAGTIRFANGASMNFEVSWAVNMKETGIFSYVFGKDAGVSLDPLEVYGEDSNYLVDLKPTIAAGDPFAREIRHFLDCIRDGSEPSIPAKDGLNVQKMLNGIYDSAKAGREILL